VVEEVERMDGFFLLFFCFFCNAMGGQGAVDERGARRDPPSGRVSDKGF